MCNTNKDMSFREQTKQWMAKSLIGLLTFSLWFALVMMSFLSEQRWVGLWFLIGLPVLVLLMKSRKTK